MVRWLRRWNQDGEFRVQYLGINWNPKAYFLCPVAVVRLLNTELSTEKYWQGRDHRSWWGGGERDYKHNATLSPPK